MAVQNTWIAATTIVTYAVDKDMLNVFNGVGSAKVIRVYRMFLFNNQFSGAGALNFVELWRNTAASGGTPVSTVPNDSTNTALDANTTAGFGQTVTNNALLRRLLSQTPAPSSSTLGMGNFLTMVPYATLWDAGYADENIQPLTAPAGYGYGIKSKTVSAGSADLEIEFTSEAS